MAQHGLGARFADAHFSGGQDIALLVDNHDAVDFKPGRIFHGEPVSTSPENAP
jgi:hypothetical protein